MYTSKVKIYCLILSKIKILAFLKIVKKVAKFLAILGKKIVARSLQKLPKFQQIATSGHTERLSFLFTVEKLKGVGSWLQLENRKG